MAGVEDTFTLVPADAELTVDERLDAALTGLQPDANPDDTLRPFGRGWAFDHQQGEFVMHGSSPAVVSGLTQLTVWIEKTLRTARFAHVIYTDEYGVDNPWEGIGFPFSSRIGARIAKNVTDALTVHDRITAVQDFQFDGVGTSQLFVSFSVITDDPDATPLALTVPFGV